MMLSPTVCNLRARCLLHGRFGCLFRSHIGLPMPFSGIPPPVSGPGVSSRSAATLESRPIWLIVEDGIRQYIEAMAPEDRRMLEAITRRTELRRSGKLTHPCSPKVTQAF
jgi:hypothetical protein